ncbi:hypothetical protein MMC32_003093 [Xylographa parallela]|nr:hypothetical protein [Xylographa parallela]
MFVVLNELSSRIKPPKTNRSQRVTADKILQQYKERNPTEDVVLKNNGRVIGNDTMAMLDVYGDQVIAFEAVKKSDIDPLTATAVPRKPLQPSGRQISQPRVSTPDYLASDVKKEHMSPYPGAKVHGHLRSPSKPKARLEDAYLYRMGTRDENIPPSSTLTPLSQLTNTSSSTSYPVPPAHQLSGGAQQSGRPGIIDKSDPGFMKWLANMRESHVPINEYDKAIQEQSAWDSWMLFTPEQREAYSVGAASHSEQVQEDDVMSEIDFKDQFITEAEPNGQIDDQQPKTFQLQNLIADASLDVLESSVERGVKFLDDLKDPLLERVESSPDAAQWVQQIDKLRNQAVKTRTVIGVVGNTGAGKSSVINAMLDEERLVPTNTMRACTAVVTELSYNYDDDAYRAEIEFITIADWEKELQILFNDLLDDSGNVSRDCANPDTDAGIAYAKIKAVYPKKTKEDISNSNIKNMLQDVSHILGNTRKIRETDSLMFYKVLQHFVDSKEKVTGKKDKDKKNEPK